MAHWGFALLAVGLRDGGTNGLSDRAGPWLCASLRSAGGGLFGPARFGRLGALSSVRASHAPDLPGPPAAPLPGNARGGHGVSRGIPAPGTEPSAGGLGGEGPSRRRADQPSRRAHCHGTVTGSHGAAAGAGIDRSRQPALGQAPEAP